MWVLKLTPKGLLQKFICEVWICVDEVKYRTACYVQEEKENALHDRVRQKLESTVNPSKHQAKGTPLQTTKKFQSENCYTRRSCNGLQGLPLRYVCHTVRDFHQVWSSQTHLACLSYAPCHYCLALYQEKLVKMFLSAEEKVDEETGAVKRIYDDGAEADVEDIWSRKRYSRYSRHRSSYAPVWVLLLLWSGASREDRPICLSQHTWPWAMYTWCTSHGPYCCNPVSAEFDFTFWCRMVISLLFSVQSASIQPSLYARSCAAFGTNGRMWMNELHLWSDAGLLSCSLNTEQHWVEYICMHSR